MSISYAIWSFGRWMQSLPCQYFREDLLSVFGANYCTLHLVWKGWLTRTNMWHSRHGHLSHSAAQHLASSIARSPFHWLILPPCAYVGPDPHFKSLLGSEPPQSATGSHHQWGLVVCVTQQTANFNFLSTIIITDIVLTLVLCHVSECHIWPHCCTIHRCFTQCFWDVFKTFEFFK